MASRPTRFLGVDESRYSLFFQRTQSSNGSHDPSEAHLKTSHESWVSKIELKGFLNKHVESKKLTNKLWSIVCYLRVDFPDFLKVYYRRMGLLCTLCYLRWKLNYKESKDNLQNVILYNNNIDDWHSFKLNFHEKNQVAILWCRFENRTRKIGFFNVKNFGLGLVVNIYIISRKLDQLQLK